MKRFLALIMALTMVFALCACGSGSTAASSSTAASTGTSTETYNIKLGHSDTVDNLLHVSLLNFKAYVEEKSEGRLKVAASRWTSTPPNSSAPTPKWQKWSRWAPSTR